MEVDIACVGFGPAMGGFLTTLSLSSTANPPTQPSRAKSPPACPSRSSATSAPTTSPPASAASSPAPKPSAPASPPSIPPISPWPPTSNQERVFYLLDPHGASRRSPLLRLGDRLLAPSAAAPRPERPRLRPPLDPRFLNKHGGLILSIGQFNQWVGSQLMASRPGADLARQPVAAPLFDGKKVEGLRLADQGVERSGAPTDGFMPGMDMRAALTVVGDGPVGAIGQALDRKLGLPAGHARREWALGMKMVIELPANAAPRRKPPPLQPGTVWHTFGYPEPEIFGFLYVHPDRLVSVGIFVPSWMSDPSRTAYRYLQHYIQHPALWQHLKDGTLRSWGAKSLEESGRHGEPFLTGDGFARIGEGSGSTNMLTGSGVDEAWTTGTQLAESVVELLRAGKPFTQENLAATYEKPAAPVGSSAAQKKPRTPATASTAASSAA